MKKMKHATKKLWLAMLSIVMLVALGLALVACGGSSKRINTPERLEEDIGTGMYIVPRYEVVDQNGMILAGYNVTLKSATDPNGEAAEISRGNSTIVTIEGPGEYKFVFTANNKDVKDTTVIMDFADRKAPTASMSSSLLPDFYIKGNTYAIPEYSLVGDFDASRCYAKVFYTNEAGTETEVDSTGGQFAVDQSNGKYTILIHVEDAAGNFNDYRYARKVDGPEHYDANTVVYFNEAFGARQVEAEGDYTGKFVAKDEDGGKAYGDEAGSYKVTFTGAATENNEAYFNIRVPAVANVMDYKELEMYVFIEDDGCEAGASAWVVGSKWWNDQSAKVGEWTRITWSIENWGNGKGDNVGSVNTNVISTDNIAGTRIRLIPDCDYSHKTAPHATVYFSAMRAIPYDWSEITAEEGVTVSSTRVRSGETVTLKAAEQAGQFFECFVVNDKPISGDSFVAYEEKYTVSVRYSDKAISKDHFTWGEYDFTEPTLTISNWGAAHKIGSDSNWVLRYDITELNADSIANKDIPNQWYVGVLFRNNQILGYEMGEHAIKQYLGSAGHGTGSTWDKMQADLGAALDVLKSASETNPVTLTFVRRGNTFSAYVKCNDILYLVVKDKEHAAFGSEYGLDFGFGWRTDCGGIPTISNIEYVVGEELVGYALDSEYAVTVNVSGGASTDRTSYALGDTVTLTHDAAPSGEKFAYYTVDGTKIEGNSFTATKSNHTVAAVYSKISALTLGADIETADGETEYACGVTVTLAYKGTVPTGKFFDCFTVDNEPINGNTFIATKTAHTVGVKFFTDSSDMTWGAEEYVEPEITISNWGKAHKLGSDSNWVVRYDITELNADSTINAGIPNMWYVGVLFRNNQILGYEMGENATYKQFLGSAGDGAGSTWEKMQTDLGAALAVLNGASETNPVTLIFIRQGNTFTAYVECDGVVYSVVKAKTHEAFDSEFGLDFGYGWRTDCGGIPTLENIKFIAGEDKVNAYLATFTPTITVADSKIHLDKTSYEIGDTVTLSHDTIESGYVFSHYTVDGEPIEGNTFTICKKTHTVGIVCTQNSSTISLPEGVTANGEDGESLIVAEGATVTLAYTGTAPNFDYFKVDGEKIEGNTFTATQKNHTVTVEFFTSAADMTWSKADYVEPEITISNWGKAHKLGSDSNWVLRYDITELNADSTINADIPNMWYVGVLFRNNQILGYEMGEHAIKQFLGSAGDGAGSTWAHLQDDLGAALAVLKSASETNPVTLIFIRQGNTFTAYVECDGVVYSVVKAKTHEAFGSEYGLDFGYGWRTDCGGIPTISNIAFVTGADKANAFVAAQTVTITKAENDNKVGTEKDSYALGDTVTLTHATADQGFGFSHYLVDGVALEKGVNTFVATKSRYTVSAVYVSEIESYRLVIAEHEKFVQLDADGVYVLPAATLQGDNGEITGYTIVVAVEGYTVSDNRITVSYRGAVELKITYSVEELEGKEVEITVLVQPEDGMMLTVDENIASRIDAQGNTVGYTTDIKYTGSDSDFVGEGSLKVTKAKQDTQIWLNKYDFRNANYLRFYVYTTAEGAQVGSWWFGDKTLKANEWTEVVLHLGNMGIVMIDDNGDTFKPNENGDRDFVGKFILRFMGTENAEYYVSSVKAYAYAEEYGPNKVNFIKWAESTRSDCVANTKEYVNEKPNAEQFETAAAGFNVMELGALKVTANANGEIALNTPAAIIGNISNYDAVYFWVYTENSTTAWAGSWWCNDTQLTAGAWTKVCIEKSKGPWGVTGSGSNPFTAGASNFVYRIRDAKEGDVFYLTSLYVMPSAD